MGAGRFVGRVGGLAVALGVGAAISLGSGIAWADENPGGGSESGGAAPGGQSAAGSANTVAGTSSSSGNGVKNPDAGPDSSVGAGHETEAESGATGDTPAEPHPTTSGAGSSHKRKPSTSSAGVAKRGQPEAPKSSVTSRPVGHDDDATSPAPRAVKETPVAVAASAAPVAEVQPAAPVVAQASGVVAGAVAESSLLGGVPNSPLVNSPILWVAAAASRRGFGGGSDVPEEGASLAAAAAAGAAAAGAVPNTPPTATVTVGTPNTTTGVVTGTVKGVDVDKDVLTYSAPATTTKGSVVISATNGKFTYTPTVDARQTAATSADPADKQDSFVVTVTDAHGATGTVTVHVGIDPNNIPTPPVGVLSTINPITGVVAGTIKGADQDKDKLTYTANVVTTAKGGKVTLNATTGAFTYTPSQAAREAAAGTDVAAKQDSFTVTIKDAQGASIAFTVDVVVSPNKAPVVAGVTLNPAAPANGAVTGTVNAADPDGGLLKYAVGATATKSKITIDANTGALTYTPTVAARHAASLSVGAVITDSFTVSITDAKGAVTNQLVTVQISPFNATPTSSLPAGKTNIITGVVTGTIKTADADKDKLTFSASTLTTTKGTFTLNTTTGAYTYAPNQAARLASGAAAIGDPAKSDSITITISDGHTNGTITQPLTVPVAPNTAPITPSVTPGTSNPTTGAVTGTVKAVDPDKDALKYTTPASTGKGAVTINTKTGAFTYTPTQAARQAAADGVAGAQSDSFTVTITDARGASITQDVTVAVSPNKAPIDAIIINQNTNPTTGVVTGAVNATDPDGAPGVGPKYTVVSPPSGKVTINTTTGAFVYTPSATARHAASLTANPVTSDTFTVSITDVKGAVTTQIVPVTITPANAVPTSTVTVNKPNPATGIVTGTVKGADADKDLLTYSTPASTTKGTVTVNATTGAFIYTPSATARDKAAGTALADKTDTFTVTITDGHTGGVKTQDVLVAIAPKAAVGVIGTVDLAGENYEAVMNGNGTRAVITTVTGNDTSGYSTSVTVINTTTGAKVGSTLKLTGQSNGVVFTDDGTKAVVATYVSDTDTGSTRVAVINAGTGKQIGATLTLAGSAYLSDALQFNADGSRAILTLDGYDEAGTAVQRLTLVNTLTGVRMGITRQYLNDRPEDDLSFLDPVTIELNPDGSRLIVTTHTADPDINVESTQVTIINTTTGDDVGTTTVTGGVYSPVSYNADYSRAILAYTDIVDDTTFTTHVIVLNVTTGAHVGPLVDQLGSGAAQLSDDGSLFVVNTTINDGSGNSTSSIAVYTAAGGVRVGNAVTVAGATILPAQFNAAGTRAVVTVYPLDNNTPTAVRVVVINTATGAQVGVVDVAGTPAGFDGSDARTLHPLQLTTDGSRALVTTTDGGFTNVALIATLTGTQLGATLTVPGEVTFEAQDGTSYLPPLYNDDDSRAFITTVSGDAAGGYVTRVALLSVATGAKIGSTITLAGAPGVYADDVNVLSAGNRAVYLTYTGDSDTGYTTRLAVINTDIGTQLGATRTFTGTYTAYVQFNAAGNRLVVVTDTASTDTEQASTELSVFDALSGAQLGNTLTFTGDDWTGATVDDDPSRAIVYTANATSSTVTAVDLLTANRIGSTVTLTGEAWSTYRSDDSSRVVVASLTGTGTKIATKVATLQIGGPTGAPINGAFTADSPNVTSGVVTGMVTATDSEGDPLSYSGTQTTTNGTVAVASDGTFTYTPTPAARHAALTANGAQTDTFNVTASDTLGNSLVFAVTVAIQPGANAAPANAVAGPSQPNPTTGVVTGTLSATDADGDTLTYTGPSNTTKGSLSITGTTFTYTPTAAARQAAAAAGATAADLQDTFTITVSDSHGGTAPISVTVAIAPATTSGVSTVSTVGAVTLAGSARDAYFSGDGTRAVVATMTTGGIAVSVLNTATGTQIGNSVTVGGVTVTAVQFSTDGSRAVVSTNDSDDTIDVAIINTLTGTQVGTTYTASNAYTAPTSVGGFSAVLNADGTRAAIASTADDGSAPLGTVVVLNTATGVSVYDSGQVAGIASVSFSANGGRAVVTFQAANAPITGTTSVKFVNAVTGAPIGSTLTRTGASSVSLNADGSKAILADFTQTASGGTPVLTTKVALYAVGGNQIGSTVTLASAVLLPPQFTADGNRAALTTLGIDVSTPSAPYRTGLVVINGTTGAQVGAAVTLIGFPGGLSDTTSSPLSSAVLNSAGTRATLVARSVDGASTTVAVVNLTTGTQVGNTITATGGAIGGSAKLVQASADGSRVLVNSFTHDVGGGSYTSDVIVIDTTTGAKLTEITETSSNPVAVQLTADGARLLVGRTDGVNTTMSMVNAVTGAQIGSTLSLAGLPAGPAEFSADGTRAVVAAGTTGAPQVVVINTVTGAQIGTTAVLTGLSPGGPTPGARLSANGTYIVAPAYSTTGSTTTTAATILKIS